MKKILIIGGSSLLAVNLVYKLRKSFQIYLACNKKKPIINNLKKFHLNFNNKLQVKRKILKINPDIIILAAAITDIEKCQRYKKNTLKVNYLLNKNVVDLVKNYLKKTVIIYISTDQVYSGSRSFSDEKDKLVACNYYTQTKILSENYIKTNLKNFLILRTNFFGYGPKYRESFSDKILTNYKKRIKIIYFDDVFFSPIYLPIFCNILLKIIKKKIKGIYNLCSSERISKYKFADIVYEKFKFNKIFLLKGQIKKNNSLIKRPKDMSMSNVKIKKIIKFQIPTIQDQITLMRKDYKKKHYNFLKKIKILKK